MNKPGRLSDSPHCPCQQAGPDDPRIHIRLILGVDDVSDEDGRRRGEDSSEMRKDVVHAGGGTKGKLKHFYPWRE